MYGRLSGGESSVRCICRAMMRGGRSWQVYDAGLGFGRYPHRPHSARVPVCVGVHRVFDTFKKRLKCVCCLLSYYAEMTVA